MEISFRVSLLFNLIIGQSWLGILVDIHVHGWWVRDQRVFSTNLGSFDYLRSAKWHTLAVRDIVYQRQDWDVQSSTWGPVRSHRWKSWLAEIAAWYLHGIEIQNQDRFSIVLHSCIWIISKWTVRKLISRWYVLTDLYISMDSATGQDDKACNALQKWMVALHWYNDKWVVAQLTSRIDYPYQAAWA